MAEIRTAGDLLWDLHGMFPGGASEMLDTDFYGATGLQVGEFWIRVQDVADDHDRPLGWSWCVWTRDADGEPIPAQEGFAAVGQEGDIATMVAEMRQWALNVEPIEGPTDDADGDWHGQQDAYDARVYGGAR